MLEAALAMGTPLIVARPAAQAAVAAVEVLERTTRASLARFGRDRESVELDIKRFLSAA